MYANNKVRDFFLSDTNQLLGNYLKCNYTIEEKTYCQNTSNCYKCTLNNTIKKVIESNNAETLERILSIIQMEKILIYLLKSHV